MTTVSTTPAPAADKRKALGRGLESLLPGGPRPAAIAPVPPAPLPPSPAHAVAAPPPPKQAMPPEQMREHVRTLHARDVHDPDDVEQSASRRRALVRLSACLSCHCLMSLPEW